MSNLITFYGNNGEFAVYQLDDGSVEVVQIYHPSTRFSGLSYAVGIYEDVNEALTDIMYCYPQYFYDYELDTDYNEPLEY